MMPHQDFHHFLEFLAKTGAATPATIAQQRDAFRKLCLYTDGTGPAVVTARPVALPTPDGPCQARLYTPPHVTGHGPGLVYFHGGGYVLGDLDTHDAFCRRLCDQSGVRVLAVAYRLAPEHKFPAAHDDALAAALWVRDHGAKIGIDPAAFAIGGDSAGGNLAAAACVALRDRGGRQPRLQILLYPGFDPAGHDSLRRFGEGYFLTAQAIADFMRQLAVPAFGPDRRRVSPDQFANLDGLPAAYITTAGFDPLQDGGRHYARKLCRANVFVEYRHYPEFIHGFYTMAKIAPDVLPAIADLAQALRRGLGLS